MQESGQPGASSKGGTGEAKRRGNPELGLQSRRRMRESGQLEAPSPAQSEDAGFGATWNLVRRLNGTIDGSRTCRITAIETPGTSVSGVFVFGRCLRLLLVSRPGRQSAALHIPRFAKRLSKQARRSTELVEEARGGTPEVAAPVLVEDAEFDAGNVVLSVPPNGCTSVGRAE